MPQTPAERSLASLPEVVGHAADWVHCDSHHGPLAERLFGRAYVVERIGAALDLAAGAPDSFRFVTVDGRVVAPGGLLHLNASASAPGLISRKAEIRQLRAQLDDDETRLEQETRAKNALEACIADVQLQREARLRDSAVAQKSHAEQQTLAARLGDELTRLERELSVIESELRGLRESLAADEQELARLQGEQAAADDSRATHESRVDALQRELNDLSEALSELTRRLTEARIEVGRVNERRAASEQALRELQERVAGLSEERAVAEREADEADQAIEANDAELAQTTARMTAVEGAAGEQQAQLEGLQQRRQALRAQVEQCSGAGREIHAAIEALGREHHERELALREMEVRQEDLAARVSDELELDLAALHAGYEPVEQDWGAIKDEIEALRLKIQRLGNVNLDALHELEALQPRYDGLLTQRQDLLDAVAQLEQLIIELDDESRRRFNESFAAIREHFQGLFRKLFGGGKADIILEDPEQPLECGIDIIARPPGKEPQSISLLSGGEKTMTAVALLLAVFKSRPSPFAIMDEVDAALDEANVGRFNDCVQEFLAHSQFVIITHNKRTMQSADVLYGVTMEETGVSKRVSVRFDDRADTPNVA